MRFSSDVFLVMCVVMTFNYDFDVVIHDFDVVLYDIDVVVLVK